MARSGPAVLGAANFAADRALSYPSVAPALVRGVPPPVDDCAADARVPRTANRLLVAHHELIAELRRGTADGRCKVLNVAGMQLRKDKA